MRDLRPVRGWVVMLLGSLMTLSGCTDAALHRLSLDEQAEFATYWKVMTPAQERAYLAQATAAARTAYLREIGVVQRFQALAPLDRDAVRSGLPRPGMSADALQFLWGAPYATAGEVRGSAHWWYLGSSLGLAGSGNQYRAGGDCVDVYLVDGHVVGWVEIKCRKRLWAVEE